MNAWSKTVTIVERAAQDRPKGVANGVLVGQFHQLERARRVVHLTRADAETLIATEGRAECDRILVQAGKGVHRNEGPGPNVTPWSSPSRNGLRWRLARDDAEDRAVTGSAGR